MKTAWLIQNLVPYHHARFEAFTRNPGVEGHLIQVTDKDEFRVLEYTVRERSYALHTLFPGSERADVDRDQIRRALAECLDAIRPDCVCVSGWGMIIGLLMLDWGVYHHVPVVVFSESTAHDAPRVAWREWIKARLIRSCSSALVGGAPHRDYLIKLGMPPGAIWDGHNAVDNAHFATPAAARPEALPALLERRTYFATCARFGEKKNLPGLVRAYAGYVGRCRAEQKKAALLVIAGEGPLRGEIEAEIVRAALQDQVILPGPVAYSDLPWLYQNGIAYVHPSTTEQWGLVVNEAMAAGAPLLLSKNCGCTAELLREGKNGFAFDPYDEQQMAEALFRMAAFDSAALTAFGNESRAIIREWGSERFARGLLNAVDYALNKASHTSGMAARMLLCVMVQRDRIS